MQKLSLELTLEERGRFLAAFDDEHAFRANLPKGRRFGLAPMESKAAALHFRRFRELRPVFVVALETGLRKGDLLALKWSSVNLRDGWVRVAMGKTGEVATVPISTLCCEALKECSQHEALSPELVFAGDCGEPVAETRVLRAFRTAKKLAGITRRFRFHDLRHSFGSGLASEGVSLQAIQKMLGHTTAKMSERYARPDENALRRAVAALDRLAVNSSRELVASAGGSASGRPVGKSPAESAFCWWEVRGSNPRPAACKADALPLS